MSGQHMRKIVDKLIVFEKKPKHIEGRLISEWFRIAEDIFTEFYKLGANINWDFSIIKKQTEISDVINIITENKEWIQTFINIYPNLRIDLDLVGSAGDICKVRSGIEVLLRGFQNFDSSFNKVLTDLEEFGEVDELDRYLKVWSNTGHRPDFESGCRQSNTPQSHWWWY